MSKKMIYLISFVLVLALMPTGYSQVLIGDWENVMDGWLIDPCAPPGTTMSYSTTGVTLNTKSLKVDVNNHSGWNQAIYIPLDDEDLVDEFFDNDVFSLDITRLAAEWTITDPCDPNLGWSDLHVIINADSDSGPVWIDLGADNSLWNYAEGNDTSTAKWDYSGAKAQIDKASVSNLDLILVSNYDPNYTSGGIYYLDKARLEPLSYLNVIGNFENVMDNWTAGTEDSPVLAFASTGVTLDSHSLSLTTTGGYWCLSWNAPAVPASLGGVTLKFDLTMIASEWQPSQPWTKVADKIALNSDVNQPGNPYGAWKEYSNLATAIDRTTGNPTSLDWGAWSGDAEKTISLDISDYNLTGATWFQINISVQGGNGTGHFYFDNVRLSSAGPAYDPNPANNARQVPTDTTLSWAPGLFADKHDIYLGTDKTKVDSASRSNPLGMLREQDYGPNNYDPGELTHGKTYYWRIDEVNQAGPDPCHWKGDVWKFTTEYAPPGVVIGDWEDNLDGWLPGEGDPTLSYSTTGATLNDKSLRIEVGDLWYWVITLTLSPEQIEALKANDVISLDVTWVTSEWTGGGSWAQVRGISINADGIGWNQVNPPTGDTSNPDSPGDWNPYDFGEIDTRTITWNYGASDINDVAGIPEGGYCYLQFATQFDAGFGTGTYYFDNARLLDSRLASNPDPQDGATDVEIEPTLRWTLGRLADTHDVYFGTDEDAVTDANRTIQLDVLIEQDYDSNSIDIADEVGTLEFETTYYWRIDEVNDSSIRKGNVWRFKTGHFLVIDDFESYNPSLEDTWIASSKAEVSLSTDPVHEGAQAMAIDYDNNTPAPYYSEAYADTDSLNLSFGTNWLAEGVEGLSLWFRGCPDVRGSFDGNDPYTLVGAGWDIEDTADGFHYAYTKLTSAFWRVQARVDSIDDTDPWAKAGVMVRKTLEPGSIHASVMITPENGALFQWRETANEDTSELIDPNIAAPHWIRVTRKLPEPPTTTKIIAEHSSDGSTWFQIGEPLTWSLVGSVSTPIYIGLCVTSHDEFELCTAELSNVYMAKDVKYNNPDGNDIGDPNADKDIGIPYNDPEPVYVVLEDSDSNGIVYHSDPNAVQESAWTHWGIELDEFSEDVDLTDVQSMYIGFGNRGNPTQGGAGTVHVDDIRLYARGCTLSNRSDDFAKADYAPEDNPAGDCVVDYREIDIMGRDWLKTPPPNSDVDLYVDSVINFKDFAILAQFWLEEQISLWP